MSDTVNYSFSWKSAIAYNAKFAKKNGWYGNIPEKVFDTYPGLVFDAINGTKEEKTEFASTLMAFQVSAGFDKSDQDGKFGRHTWDAMLRMFDPVSDHEDFVYWGGRRFGVDHGEIITWDDSGGLDLHKDGGWRKDKNREVRLVVIHWGGLHPKQCRNVLANRDLSSHFGIGKDGVYQWLDMAHVAFHAGYPNSFSVGIDICEQPERKWADWYAKKGYQKEPVVNTSGRGSKKILSLDPRTASNVQRCVKAICDVTNVPYRFPRGSAGFGDAGPVWHGTFAKSDLKAGKFMGVVGHHHISKKKWDMACWWDEIFGTDSVV
ncbi:hypothetical protein CMI47_20410 [Candidatus Pacearchaeota archaeon]|nr:hypothetical protein [Candidatus Pacearchaeota archaeon]|tara:strand:- start:4430 stop:5389 length:960 start_codon:yes stop_codon:yes gene_type:complete